MMRRVLMTVVGHVDHGKSSILDRIRGTNIVEKEAGLITQAIGASIIPLETIKNRCGELLKTLKFGISVPGIVAIDTPGHAAFTNLRKRGGSLADISVVVVDINEGFMPQTVEVVEILKQHKTPFIIAANKIDLIAGWRVSQKPILEAIKAQTPEAQKAVETKIYELVGQLFEKFGINGERFDRVDDYTKTIAIVPASAETGEGIPELLMMIVGLAQKYLEQELKCNIEGPAKGTVMEVKEEKGVGKVLDAIIYDGHLNLNDTLIVGGVQGPITIKVKALFEPAPLSEIRDKKTRFSAVKSVSAATCVRISAKDAEEVISGMPFEGVGNNIEETKKKVQEQIEEVMIETDKSGVVIKADSLGSLEAMITLLKEKIIPIRKASIGNITRKDIADAESNLSEDPLLGVVLGFNVKELETAASEVKVITSDVIYTVIESLERWREEKKRAIERKEFESITRPFKLEVMRGYVFRQSNPAVFGVSVLEGTLRTEVQLMKSDGKVLSIVKSIEAEQETIPKVERNRQVAIAVPHVIIGRQLKEGDILYSYIPEEHFRKLKEFKQFLSDDEKEALKEIAVIMRKNNPLWGI